MVSSLDKLTRKLKNNLLDIERTTSQSKKVDQDNNKSVDRGINLTNMKGLNDKTI
jgi:hypothetical protein